MLTPALAYQLLVALDVRRWHDAPSGREPGDAVFQQSLQTVRRIDAGVDVVGICPGLGQLLAGEVRRQPRLLVFVQLDKKVGPCESYLPP